MFLTKFSFSVLIATAFGVAAASPTCLDSLTPAFVADDPISDDLRRIAGLVAITPVPVLILGESGTGKEELARLIHALSPRSSGPFVPLNCSGGLSSELLGSQLFGYVKGAFTGAYGDRDGLFKTAHGGTLFLDEIGEMPPDFQAQLLRVLEDKRIRPIGSDKEIAVDARIVAATHRDIETMVKEGRFREDLYYRLNVVAIRTPRLAQRLGDIEGLVKRFLAQYGKQWKRPDLTFDETAMATLRAYPWPGNVRELRNVVARTLALNPGRTSFSAADLRIEAVYDPADASFATASTATSSTAAAAHPVLRVRSLQDLADAEREIILRAYKAADYNKTKAALAIGMPNRTFHERLKQYGIKTKEKPRSK